MIALINTVCEGSTGKIITGLQEYLLSQGKEAVVCYGRGPKPSSGFGYKFNSKIEVYWHYFLEHLTGQMNVGSQLATKRLVKFLRKNNVKEVFLENLHGHYLNERILFDYLVKDKIKVVYIMAAETPYWGNCGYNYGCTLNKQECIGCKQIKGWQRTLFGEVSHRGFTIKKDAYDKMDAIYVAPKFVIKCASETPLLKGKRFEIVDEAINVTTQQPRDTSELRAKLGIADDMIIISCVAPFSYTRKGVKWFIEAAKRLEKDGRFVFVHVGYDSDDKTNLPKNYIPIGFVSNQEELSYYYSLGDLFVFPSQADTMPNACLEALACGTPLLCFNVSGMPYIGDETVMTLVELNNVDQMVEEIQKTQKKTQQTIDTCRNYALKRYDNQKYFERLTAIMDKLNK